MNIGARLNALQLALFAVLFLVVVNWHLFEGRQAKAIAQQYEFTLELDRYSAISADIGRVQIDIDRLRQSFVSPPVGKKMDAWNVEIAEVTLQAKKIEYDLAKIALDSRALKNPIISELANDLALRFENVFNAGIARFFHPPGTTTTIVGGVVSSFNSTIKAMGTAHNQFATVVRRAGEGTRDEFSELQAQTRIFQKMFFNFRIAAFILGFLIVAYANMLTRRLSSNTANAFSPALS